MTMLPVVGAPRLRYDVSARVEGRYRDPGNYRFNLPSPGAPWPRPDTEVPAQAASTLESHAWDLDGEATLRLAALWRRARVAVSYGPRYAVGDIFGEVTRSLLHRGDASVTLSFPRVQLSFSEYASYGELSYAGITQRDPLAGQTGQTGQTGGTGMVQGATVQTVPITNELAYVSSDTTLTSGIRTSRRTQLTLTMSYSLSGGADKASRRVMPRSESPRAAATVGWDATRRDSLTTTVEASYTRMTSVIVEVGPDLEEVVRDAPPITTKILRVGEGWRRRWSRTTSTSLAGGVEVIPTPAQAAVFSSGWPPMWVRADPDGPEGSPTEAGVGFYPYGSASITQTWAGPRHSRFAAGANVSISTLVDRLTGFPDRRWNANADLTWTIRPWVLHGGFGHSQSLDASSPNAVQVTSLDLNAAYELTKKLDLESGMRMFQQDYSTTPSTPIQNITQPDTLRWVVYVALSFHLGEQNF